MSKKIEISDIKRLALEPGDIVVIKHTCTRVSVHKRELIRDWIAGALPAGTNVLILDSSMELSIIGPAAAVS